MTTYIRILSLLIVSLTAIAASGQTNLYGIADELYKIFEKCEEDRTDTLNLLRSRTMEMLAIEQGDKKAECIAHCIRTNYYGYTLNPADKEKMMAESKALRTTARKNGFLQYYYYGYLIECSYLLETHNSLDAIRIGNQMQEDARNDDYPYGIYTCHVLMGNIYSVRNSLLSALKEYECAMKYLIEKVPGQSPGEACRNCASISLVMGNTQKATELATKGYEHPLTHPDVKVQLLSCICLANFMEGKHREFSKNFKVLKASPPEHMASSATIISAFALADLLDGKPDKAETRLKEIMDNVPLKFKMLMIVEQMRGNFHKAFSYADSAQNVILSNFDNSISDDMLTLSSAIENASLRQSNTELERSIQQNHLIVICVVVSLIAVAVILIFMQHEKAFRRMQQSNVELEKERRKAVELQHRAEHSEQVKMLFIQNMSHEIRTPLNAICGFSQIVAEPAIASTLDEDELRKIRFLISSNTEQLTTLIDDLLGLSDMESGKYKISLCDVSVNALCRETLSSVMHRKPSHVEMTFETDIPDETMLHTDKHRVRQVLTNLLTNACKHTDEGSITLRCSHTENPGHLTFSVTDTGEGIPADKAELIFGRFEKLDTFKQGTGLGLAICRLIAEALHSKIFLDTKHSGGARFVFVTQDNE